MGSGAASTKRPSPVRCRWSSFGRGIGDSPLKVLLIGAPGSGKSTQGQRLADQLGLEYIAAGDLLRAQVEARSALGLTVAAFVAQGRLVPDDLIIELVVPALHAAARRGGYVLDGFPRSLAQMCRSWGLGEKDLAGPDAVIFLAAPRDVLVERVLARAKVEGRPDDTLEVVNARIRDFDETTLPLVEYYRTRGLLRSIDASRSKDEVTRDILAALHQSSETSEGRPDR